MGLGLGLKKTKNIRVQEDPVWIIVIYYYHHHSVVSYFFKEKYWLLVGANFVCKTVFFHVPNAILGWL